MKSFSHHSHAYVYVLNMSTLQHGRKEINVELMKEAEFFGDIVIVPYMDNYDLVVLKTVAICEYGVSGYKTEFCQLSCPFLDFLPSDELSSCHVIMRSF